MCWEHMSQEDETSALSVEASHGVTVAGIFFGSDRRFVIDSSTGRVASSLVYVRTAISNADLVSLGMFV